jgi:hypothetical protein
MIVVMAGNSALSMVCRSGCDLISILVVVLFVRSTIDAPRAGLPPICEPSAYIKSECIHATWNCVIGVLSVC